jgi:hypothetical protein
VVITQWGDVATPDCHLWRAGDAGAEALTAEGACVEEPSWDRSTVARERVRVSWRLLALMPRSTPADSGRAADAASCAMGGGLCAGARQRRAETGLLEGREQGGLSPCGYAMWTPRSPHTHAAVGRLRVHTYTLVVGPEG